MIGAEAAVTGRDLTRKSRYGAALLCTTALIGAANAVSLRAEPAATQASVEQQGKAIKFDIPAGDIGPALTDWAEQSNVRLVASTDALKGVKTDGVKGVYAPDEALDRLLSNTELRSNFTGKRTVTILTPSSLDANAQAALPTIDVSETSSKNGPAVQGYVPKRSAGGTKTNTSILETPQAISVVGREQIFDQASQTIVEALRYTAGVSTNVNPNDTRFESLRIRGFEPVLYLDGMQLPFGSQLFGRPKVDPFMLDRVEVLKGPSSALYGQLAPGGMINMVSLLPTSTPTHTIEFQANSFGQVGTAFDIGGPTDAKGDLLYRITGVLHDGGTQIDYVNDFRAPSRRPSHGGRPSTRPLPCLAHSRRMTAAYRSSSCRRKAPCGQTRTALFRSTDSSASRTSISSRARSTGLAISSSIAPMTPGLSGKISATPQSIPK
jgi:outer membrane receptor protein involved in Fe transport